MRIIDVEVPQSCYDSGSQAYDFLILKLKHRVTNPNLKAICVNVVGSNPVINKVFGVRNSKYLNESDIIDSVMICAGVPDRQM
jgi:hypothetical protein